MKKVISMGEALIDFIALEKDMHLKDVSTFKKMPGGAPANVCATVAKLGGSSVFLGMVGKDAFGDYLIETLQAAGVQVDHVKQTDQAKTGLAFVSLHLDGQRDFSFYRNPSADQLLTPEDVDLSVLEQHIFHFCSVSLDDYPIKEAHRHVLKTLQKNKGIVSFDPNVRLALWKRPEVLHQAIEEFLPFADILKIADDELLWITKCNTEQEAIEHLRRLHWTYLIVTKGSQGVTLYLKDDALSHKGFKVETLDTTGAGDAWIGAFLYQVSKKGMTQSHAELHEILRFSNAVAALTTTRYGAISALPDIEEVSTLLHSSKD